MSYAALFQRETPQLCNVDRLQIRRDNGARGRPPGDMHLIFNSLIGTRRNRLRINLGFPATRTNATKQTAWPSQVTIESATSQSPTSM